MSSSAKRRMKMKIKTTLELDGTYSAIDADSYDGAPESTTNFIGHGSDSWGAIQDLRNMIYDAELDQAEQIKMCRCGHEKSNHRQMLDDGIPTSHFPCNGYGCVCGLFEEINHEES